MRDMSEAPTDGTWIIGVNEAGEEARIQSRRVHPKVDFKHWAVGEEIISGNWKQSKCFYPVQWRPCEEGDCDAAGRT